jgi:hypothetical protein
MGSEWFMENQPSPQAHLQALYAPLKDAKIGCPATSWG